MKQIKIIKSTSPAELEKGVNEALKSIDQNETEIKYMLENDTIIIEYVVKITELMCVDCQYYDHTVGVARAFGLCQCHGQRVRFTEKVCDDFKDLRG